MLRNILPSIVVYGSVVSAILYDWTRPLLLKAWICMAIAGSVYFLYKLLRPASAEALHQEFVDRDNNSWGGDLEAHRKRRHARESVFRREEMVNNAKASVREAQADRELKEGIEVLFGRQDKEK